jgi:two-component system phosphate regulon sensor histidine kinase PhoR
MPLHKVEIDIPTLITRPLERVRHQAVEAGVRFELEFPTDLPPIYVDQSRLVQVLVNLLGNAIKYSRPGGKVTISARPIDEAVEIAVRDEGVGILPDDLPRIFERFFKSDRARNSDGSGLGLAIAKHIANAHGGQLTVESEYGKGSTFTISIPTDDRSAAS